MKVLILYLAFLILLTTFIPYVITEYGITHNNVNIGMSISLYDKASDKSCSVALEDYIIGVVAAEMPAEFSDEALKAQAVAARTYAVRKILKEAGCHSNGDICTDYSHCQAYLSVDELKEKWGSDYTKYINKIKSAVIATQGEYLAYNKEPAIAVFHSCSNGITEKSSDVWGGDIPYLINVESNGDFTNKNYTSYVKYNYNEFISILENNLNINVDESSNPIGSVIYSSGNNVKNIELFGNVLSGSDVRNFYSLKSTSFTLDYNDNEFVFTVSGNGHGVGMSQYGANALGMNNFTYSEILSHYYPGTEILKVNKFG